MINILMISADSEHANEIVRIISAGDFHHCVKTEHLGLAELSTPPQALEGVDLLIFDGAQMMPQDIDTLATLVAQHANLACMLLTPEPSADLLMRAMRAGVRDVQPWPVDPKGFRDAVERVAQKVAGARREGRVLSFISCKGGSGTSFIAANVGFAASVAGKRTLLIDLNQQFGETAFLVSEITPPATLAEVSTQIDRLDAAFLDACLTHVSNGFDVLAGTPDPAKAKDIKPEHLQRILNLVRHQYDLIVFDIGQSISNVSITALDDSECIFPVLQLSLPYLRSGRRLLDIFRSLGYRGDKIRVLVNRYEKKGPVSLSELEETLGLQVGSVIPEDSPAVSASINQGVPILRLAKSSAVAKSLNELVCSLTPTSKGNRQGILQRFFGKPVPSRT